MFWEYPYALAPAPTQMAKHDLLFFYEKRII